MHRSPLGSSGPFQQMTNSNNSVAPNLTAYTRKSPLRSINSSKPSASKPPHDPTQRGQNLRFPGYKLLTQHGAQGGELGQAGDFIRGRVGTAEFRNSLVVLLCYKIDTRISKPRAGKRCMC